MSVSLARLWNQTVARSPSSVAVVEAATGRTWTRSELARCAAEWAEGAARGAGVASLAGRRVGMCVPNGAAWFKAFLGLLSCGAVPVPFDPTEPEESQLAAARSVGAAWIWREGQLHPSGARARRPRRGECLVKMTSGSTGNPRGLPATHAQMEADGRQICASMGIRPSDRSLAAIPLGYSYGLGNLVVPLIVQGSRVICASSPLPHALAADALRHRPTVFPSVPPVLRALVESDVAPGSFSTLRLFISAGAPVSREVSRAFEAKFGRRIHGFYGTSETGGITFDRTGCPTLSGRSVGTPLEGVEVSPRPGGRFMVRGPAVLGKGRFSPGDLAEWVGKGELALRGRTDRVVKAGGRRFDLAEVESALRSLPGVRDAFAHMADGALAAAAATDCSATELRRHLRTRLASWKTPSRILALGAFPENARGKTDTRALRQLLSAPRTATSTSTLSSARQMSAPR